MTHDPYDEPDELPALGVVLEQDRGSLPFALIHGEALVACAVWALGQSGVTPIDADTPWEDLVHADQPLVLHDVLCPMTPPEFIAACVQRSYVDGRVVVGIRPVTDTLKQVEGGLVGATVDRDEVVSVASPIVLPAAVLAELGGLPTYDFVDLVTHLRERFPVDLVEGPAEARRVGSLDDVRVLEAQTGPTS